MCDTDIFKKNKNIQLVVPSIKMNINDNAII